MDGIVICVQKGSRAMVSEMLSITPLSDDAPLAEWWLFRRATMPGPNFVRVCCSFQFPLAVMYRFTRLTRTLPRTALVLPRRKYSTGLGIQESSTSVQVSMRRQLVLVLEQTLPMQHPILSRTTIRQHHWLLTTSVLLLDCDSI